MFWDNPLAPQHATVRENGIRTRLPASVRVATVQFQMRRISRISEFEEQVEYFVDVASDYHADFVVFPDLFTLELLSIAGEKLAPAPPIQTISEYTNLFCPFKGRPE